MDLGQYRVDLGLEDLEDPLVNGRKLVVLLRVPQ